jgi:iron complex transport system ATP-binding protein
MSPPPLLDLLDVTFGFDRRPDFLKPVSISIRAGELWAIIGPNGAGKSTLLRLMAGLLPVDSGSVRLEARDLPSYSTRERAKRIAFLPQDLPRDLPMQVRQIALLGRFPHRQLGLFESHEDYAIATQALRTTQTLDFADRSMNTLSGGEAQRVHVAAALAQQPAILLLDEPTAALDLRHQLHLFDIFQRLAADGMAIVVVTHDLNLAARFCSHVLLLDDGRSIACGPPAEVMTPDVLGPVYGVQLERLRTDNGGEWLAAVSQRQVAARSRP